MKTIFIAFLCIILFFINLSPQTDITKKFKYRSHSFGLITIPYRLFIPDNYDLNQKYPVVMALHGSGERGYDNEIQLTANKLGTVWADPVYQTANPSFVVVPQCPASGSWVGTYGSSNIDQIPITRELAAVSNMLDSLMKEFRIDIDRLYITGLSMGGYGTWDLITRFPDRFAAAVPICGGGDSSKASKLVNLPIWVFHGQADPNVPVSYSRNMISALERTGRTTIYTNCKYNDCIGLSDSMVSGYIKNHADLLYSEYKGVGHDSWNQAYNNPLLFKWVFLQSRKKINDIKLMNMDYKHTFTLLPNYPNPFNPTTVIRYKLHETSKVVLRIYNLFGQEIQKLVDEIQTPGEKAVVWDAKNYSSQIVCSGFYFYSLSSNNQIQNGKMLFLR